MKSSLDRLEALWIYLSGSSLNSFITGDIYKFKRPAGSILEDVIINLLPFDDQQLQRGIMNVNIHVPNITIESSGIQDTKQPDTARLKEIAAVALPILKDQWMEDGNYSVQQYTIIEDEVDNSHYLNIRIDFFLENV